MDYRKSALERVFELARSGKFSSQSQLRSALKAEGYSLSQIEGPTLARQLRDIMTKSRTAES